MTDNDKINETEKFWDMSTSNRTVMAAIINYYNNYYIWYIILLLHGPYCYFIIHTSIPHKNYSSSADVIKAVIFGPLGQ